MAITFKKYFSSPVASVLCYLLAFIAKAGLIRLFIDTGPDKMGLILITRNFLHGHGISVDEVYITNLSEKFFSPTALWPPGYIFILSPFLAFLEENFLVACYLVDIMTLIVYLWYLRKVLLLIGFPVWLTNICLLFNGFLINSFITQLPTDFMGMTVLLAAVFYIITITRQTSFSFWPVLLAAFFLISSFFIRYHYLPVAVILAGTLTGIGIFQKNKVLRQSGILVLVIVVAASAGLLLFQQLNTGSPFYIVSAKRGFFPENLLYIYPFVFNSFISLDFYTLQLALLFKSDYAHVLKIFKSISPCLIIILLILYCRYLARRKFRVNNSTDSFWIFGGIAAASTLGLLIVLSLMIDRNVGAPMYEWTYVEAGRYYAFPILFLQIFGWWYLFVNTSGNAIIFKKCLQVLLAITISIEISHGIYFLIKKYSRPVLSMGQIIKNDPSRGFIIRFIKEQKTKDPSRKIAVTSFRKEPGFMANWYGASGMFQPFALMTTKPKSSQPAVLLIALREKDLILLSSFLKDRDVKFLEKGGEYYFYSLHIEPSQ